ncbi:hypothetical protein AB0G15_42645 [Streptosporangium sp. NPDC023825]
MNRIPTLWNTAYGSRETPVRRFLALCALRTTTFVRALALADHPSFVSI